MAISKILHFYNPRLFIIVDGGMMWNWALSHPWIWKQIEPLRRAVDMAVFGSAQKRGDTACDAASYVAILIWAGDLLRGNPEIGAAYDRFYRNHCDDQQLPADLATYEAAAVEWLLLGLVELPPSGVTLPIA